MYIYFLCLLRIKFFFTLAFYPYSLHYFVFMIKNSVPYFIVTLSLISKIATLKPKTTN
jgi:hypothetical protein